jgi:hypothetical protein
MFIHEWNIVTAHNGIDHLHYTQSRNLLKYLALQHIPNLVKMLPGVYRTLLGNEVPNLKQKYIF